MILPNEAPRSRRGLTGGLCNVHLPARSRRYSLNQLPGTRMLTTQSGRHLRPSRLQHAMVRHSSKSICHVEHGGQVRGTQYSALNQKSKAPENLQQRFRRPGELG